MIKNDKQYEITKKQLQKFRDTLSKIKEDKLSVHPVLRAAAIASITSQIEDLEAQLKAYEQND